MCIHLFGTPLVLLCSLSPCCSDRSHTLEHLKHHFDDNQVIPLTYDPLLFKTEKSATVFPYVFATKPLRESYSHMLSRNVPILRGDQVEGPEDLNLFSEQVSTNLGAHLQMASCCHPMMPGCFF